MSADILERQSGCGARVIELRRLRAGELDAAERARVAGHVDACAACKARVASLEEEERLFLASIDVAAESARVLERLEAPPRAPGVIERLRSFLFDPRFTSGPGPAKPAHPWTRVDRVLLAQAAIVLLLIAVPVALLVPREPSTRIKGSANLEMYVKDAAGVRLARDGESLAEGDAIQFRYNAAGKRYVFVVSVTSAGAIDALYPDGPGRSVPVTPSGTHVLEGSVILDDTRGEERVFAFFSDEPLAFEEVEDAVRRRVSDARDVTRLQEIDLGRDDVHEATVLFRKE